jgi:hypothetical protein
MRLRLPNGLFPSGLPTNTLHLSSSHTCYMPCPSHPLWREYSNYIWCGGIIIKILINEIYTYTDWLRAVGLRGRTSGPDRVENSLFCMSPRLALGFTQPPTQWVPATSSPGTKRQGREADHSPTASAEVKEIWIHPLSNTPSSRSDHLISGSVSVKTSSVIEGWLDGTRYSQTGSLTQV